MKIVPPSSPRNKVLDVLRGHYLIAMLLGHMSYYIGNSLFTFYEGNSSLWVSPAEGFIFLSGFFVTYISYKRLEKYGFWNILKAFWKKAFWMYVLGVTLTIIYTVVATYFGKGPNVSGGLQSFDFQTLVIKALTYKYNYSWADILMMYVPFMILAPLLLQVFKSRLSLLVLGISALLWASNFGKSSCSTFCVSFFEVTSWQFLFILGMFVAFKKDFFANLYQQVFSNVYLKGLVFVAFILTVIASVYDMFFQGFTGSTKEILNILINKENIGAGRILVFGLWMCVYYFLIQRYIDKFPKLFRFIYEELGKNSLTTYVIQSIVLFVFYYFPLKYGFWANNLYQVLALSSVVLLLLGFKKIQNRGKNITK